MFLQTLLANDNALVSLPDDIGASMLLRVLDVHANQLEGLPSSFTALPSLQVCAS